MERKTMLDAMLYSAGVASTRGVRFHSSANDSVRRTYAELDAAARADSVSLRACGLNIGERALLVYEPGLEFLRAVYAVMYAGLVAVPVAVSGRSVSTRETVRRILVDSGARVILCDPQGARLVEGLGGETQLVILADRPQADLSTWEYPGTRGMDAALLQYTSGSTGEPKGVVVTHANLIANQRAVAEIARHDHNSVLVGWLPHFHDMGFGMYMQPIFGGFELVATSPSQFLRRPDLWLRLIDHYRGTTTVGPDFAYRLCAQVIPEHRVQDLDLSSLRTAITGSEPVRASTLHLFTDRFAARTGFSAASFSPAYGMAETTLLVTASAGAHEPGVLHVESDSLAAGEVNEVAPGSGRAVVSCGYTALDHGIAIVDPVTKSRCTDSRVGEIWVSGPSVTAGYYGKPDETARVFGWNLDGDPSTFFRTGDLGFLRAGELYVTGRLKDLIILRGRNIYPSDVENRARAEILGRRELQAAAFEWGVATVAIVVEVEPDDITNFDGLRQQLAAEFSIDRLALIAVRRGTIPRTTSGKVQRGATREALRTGELRAVAAVGPDLSSISFHERAEGDRELLSR